MAKQDSTLKKKGLSLSHSPSPFPVIIKAFQLKNEHSRQLLDAQPLDGVDLFVAFLAVVSVSTLEKVSFDVLLQGLQQVLVVSHVDVERGERLLARVPEQREKEIRRRVVRVRWS